MGECAVIPQGMKLCMGQRMMLLRVFPDLLSSDYLSFAIREPGFQRRLRENAVGSGVKHLRVGDVERLFIPIPSVAEQHEIVRHVKTLLSLADRIEARCSAAQAKADRLSESVLAKAFRGELVPTEAELARREGQEYEPASVLLERINKEWEHDSSGHSKPKRALKTKQATARG